MTLEACYLEIHVRIPKQAYCDEHSNEQEEPLDFRIFFRDLQVVSEQALSFGVGLDAIAWL